MFLASDLCKGNMKVIDSEIFARRQNTGSDHVPITLNVRQSATRNVALKRSNSEDDCLKVKSTALDAPVLGKRQRSEKIDNAESDLE